MKPKKVLVVMGSPRARGNSTLLALEAARAAGESGAEVETIRLARLKIGPCLACEGCRKAGARGCVRKDDMIPLYGKLRAADAVLISGPVYWFSISAQVKLFMDRFYAFGAESYKPLKGKRAGIILTYADADKDISGAANAIASFKDAFAYVKAPIAGIVHGSADKAGEVLGQPRLMKSARALGRKLAKN